MYWRKAHSLLNGIAIILCVCVWVKGERLFYSCTSVMSTLVASLHDIRCIIVWRFPHSQVSVVRCFQIFMEGRQPPFPTLRRFRLLQIAHGSSLPEAMTSSGIMPLFIHSDELLPRLFHSSSQRFVRASVVVVDNTSVAFKKLFLDWRRRLAGLCPERGWRESFSCRFLSCWLTTFLLMIHF